ncbi:hypothetical protein L7F22_054304 [Adiantum nelumboides]|nr:hypothetical protein [Adiantum nelumboides]
MDMMSCGPTTIMGPCQGSGVDGGTWFDQVAVDEGPRQQAEEREGGRSYDEWAPSKREKEELRSVLGVHNHVYEYGGVRWPRSGRSACMERVRAGRGQLWEGGDRVAIGGWGPERLLQVMRGKGR